MRIINRIVTIVLVLACNRLVFAQSQDSGAGGANQAMPPAARKAIDAAYDLMQQAKAVEALELYRKAIELAPQDGRVWQAYAMCLKDTCHAQRAVVAAWKAIDLSPPDAALYADLGNIYLVNRSWDAAWAVYEKAQEMRPEDKKWAAMNFIHLGWRRWSTGDNDGVDKCYKRALEIDPDNGLAMINLAALVAAAGNTDEALKQIAQARRVLNGTNDKQVLECADSIEGDIRKRIAIVPPRVSKMFEQLPARFLVKPPAGQSIPTVDPSVVKHVHLPCGTMVTMTIDESWDVSLLDSDERTFVLTPASGDDFWIEWTPLQSGQSLDDLQLELEEQGASMLTGSVEEGLSIHDFKSPSMRGRYFQLTDRSLVGREPVRGQYLHATVWRIVAGRSCSKVTFLSHRNDKATLDIMFKTLASMTSPADGGRQTATDKADQ